MKNSENVKLTEAMTDKQMRSALKDLGFTVKGKPKRELLQMITVDDFINSIRFDREE